PVDMCWVILTRGDRPDALADAVRSVGVDNVRLVVNGTAIEPTMACSTTIVGHNVGIPAGRDLGMRSTDAQVVGFLDDDAVATPGVSELVMAAFERDPDLGAVALRLVDETGATARRHVPRFGGRGA